MGAEGVFPKTNGDVLYASEVNRFSNCGVLSKAELCGVYTSGTNFQNIGSVIVSGGYLPFDRGILKVYWATNNGNDLVVVSGLQLQLVISGTGNNSIVLYSGASYRLTDSGESTIPIGNNYTSPRSHTLTFAGRGEDTWINATGSMTTTWSSTTFSNVNPGSNFVLYAQVKTPGANGSVFVSPTFIPTYKL